MHLTRVERRDVFHYTTRPQSEGERIGGEVHRVTRKGNSIRADLFGPENPFLGDRSVLKTPFVVTIKPDHVDLRIDGTKLLLRQDIYSDWIRVRFRAAPGISVYGICRFLLLESENEFGLYVTPINIDSEKPVMPISAPFVYSRYLTKRQGPFATLGLAEDTWAVNEHVLSDQHFLQQCLDVDREREEMFFDSLDKVSRGLCVAVFDGADRLQHMFCETTRRTQPIEPSGARGATRSRISSPHGLISPIRAQPARYVVDGHLRSRLQLPSPRPRPHRWPKKTAT